MATTTGQLDTLGRGQPAILTPGNTQLGFIQGGAQITDANGNPYAPLAVNLIGGALTGVTGSQPPIIPATTVIANATAAVNAVATATMAAVAAKTNFLNGLNVSTQGGTGAAAGTLTITGLLGGTITLELGCAANNAINFTIDFPMPLPASAVNVAIVATAAALGANTGAIAVTLFGFVQ